MERRSWQGQVARLASLIALVIGAAVLTIAALLIVTAARAEDSARLFLDTYELTGSRLSGLVQLIGVLLLVAAATVSLFSARLVSHGHEATRWGRFLSVAAGLTLLLAIDDLLAIHELADNLVTEATGLTVSGPGKDILELLVLGTYGVLFGLWLWRWRALAARTEWVLLTLGGGLLLASLAVDVAPHAWLADYAGISISLQGIIEDTLKLAGIAIYAAYLARTSAAVIRQERP